MIGLQYVDLDRNTSTANGGKHEMCHFLAACQMPVKHQVMGHPQHSLDSLDFAMKREAKREA